MKSSTLSFFLILIAVTPLVGLGADSDLCKVSSRADLDAVIATTTEAPLKQALTDHADAILAAAKRYPHVVAIIRTIESAPGKFEKVNSTPEALKTAAGGDLPITDEELAELAGVTQLEKLTLNRLPLTEARIARLKDFAFLKELELAERRKEHHYPEAIQANVKAALPNLTVTFIQ